MAFKNAIKILVSRFNLVWSVLLYLLVFVVVISSLALSFLVPIIKTLGEFGIFEDFREIVKAFTADGSLSAMFKGFEQLVKSIANVYSKDTAIVVNSTLLVTLVVMLAGRFLLGFYELPLIAALNARMSANAKLSFSSCMVSQFKRSTRFVLVKMLFTIIFDTLSFALIVGAYLLLKSTGLIILVPFVVMLLIVLTNSLKFSVKAFCAPMAVMEDKKIFKGFFAGISNSFSCFGRIFSTYIISWILAISLNVLILFLTFGVGFLITVPMTVVFFSVLDMTLYYKNRGLRYYIDDNTVTPSDIAKEQ